MCDFTVPILPELLLFFPSAAMKSILTTGRKK